MHRHAVIAALAAASVVTAGPAQAILINWNNPGGGSSATAANWNPSQVPAEGDILRFNLPNTYSVIFGLAADSVATHQVYAGDVTYDIVIPHGVATGFHVAPNAGQSAIARILGGTMRLGWSTSVGAGGGATGTLRISGGTASVSQNILGAPASGPVMNVGGTGVGGGTGELLVLNGGQLDLAYALNVGRFAGGTGTLRVRGAGTGAGGLRRSHVFADSTASDARVGMDNGHGILEVLDGGLFRVGRDLYVGEDLGDVGEIRIAGENAIDSSEARVKDDLRLAVNDAGGVPGGSGTITLDSLGVLVVDDSTVVGDPDGSAALITIGSHTRMMTKHLILQQPSGATIDLLGLLQVNGGTFSTNTNRLTLPGGASSIASETPRLELLNGASATFAGAGALPPLTVGTTGNVFVEVEGGARITAGGGRVTCGEQLGSNGRIYLSGGGQLHSDRSALLGVSGSGALFVQSGALADLDGLDLGVPTGFGFLEVSHPGSLLLSSGPLNVGGSTFAAGGTGNVLVSDGGVATLSSPLVAGTIWPGGEFLVISGGRVDLTGALTVRGALDVSDGVVAGGVVALRGTGRLAGYGLVQSGILAAVDSTVTITATGALEIGRDDVGGDVLMRGTVNIGPHTLTVHDPNAAVLGRVTLAGGQLHLPAGGGVVEAGKSLTGVGTITGPLVNEGQIVSIGSAGLRFGGMVTGPGQGIHGDQFVFLDGGGFEGGGLILGKVQADPGSLIRATGSLALGQFVPDAVLLRGRFECGDGDISLYTGSPPRMGGELVLQGANLFVGAPFSLVVEAGGRVEGVGVMTPGLVVDGTVAPGNPAGRLRVVGEVVLDSTATLEAELGDHVAGEWDTLDVIGNVHLGGTLDLRRMTTFAATPGDSFQIVKCHVLDGTFASVTLDDAPLSGELEVHYGTTGVWIVVPTLVAVGDDPPRVAPVLSLQLAPLASPGRHAGVELALTAAATVAINVYDVGGRQVDALWNGGLAPGRHRFELSRVPGAGVFFVRAVVSDGSGRSVMKARVVRLR